MGIVIADSLMGEITPDMAVALGQSQAKKVLIPVNRWISVQSASCTARQILLY